jgi:hypothetical protein
LIALHGVVREPAFNPEVCKEALKRVLEDVG